MSTELTYLVLSAALAGLLWLPYVVDRIVRGGLAGAVGYPAEPPVQSAWARRMMKAHANAVENLVVFGVLLLAAQAAGLREGAIAAAAILYFWARVVHLVAYVLAIPWARTLGFAGGFVAQAIIAIQLLSR